MEISLIYIDIHSHYIFQWVYNHDKINNSVTITKFTSCRQLTISDQGILIYYLLLACIPFRRCALWKYPQMHCWVQPARITGATPCWHTGGYRGFTCYYYARYCQDLCHIGFRKYCKSLSASIKYTSRDFIKIQTISCSIIGHQNLFTRIVSEVRQYRKNSNKPPGALCQISKNVWGLI